MSDTAVHPDAEDMARVSEAMAAWRRRSRLIRFWRRALPALIAVVLVSLFGWVVVRSILADVQDLRGDGAVIRMSNPRFFGQDDRGRSFMLGAREAARSPNAYQNVGLTDPVLRLDTDSAEPTVITAKTGAFDEKTQDVVLRGGVKVEGGPSEFAFTTEEARIDADSGVIRGDKPVVGSGPIGEIRASSYAIYDRGGRIVFRGRGDQQVSARIERTRPAAKRAAAPAAGQARAEQTRTDR